MNQFRLTHQERDALLDALDRGEDFRWPWYVDHCIVPVVERILAKRLDAGSRSGAAVFENAADAEVTSPSDSSRR